jgi:hypothetical protein
MRVRCLGEFIMRGIFAFGLFAAAVAAAPVALADCVDYSEARARAAGAALERNAPTAAQLGLPSLDRLQLDSARTAGDPQCGGPNPPTRYYYTTTMTFTELVTAFHSNIKRRTETDGMGRTWFRNPYFGSDQIILTSNTELQFVLGADGRIVQVTVIPANPVLALTPENQPYSVSDIVSWTPWPGGPDGSREFVRADGAAPSSAQQQASAPGQQANCPTGEQQQSAAAGAQAGAAVGGSTIGGGYGRQVGAAAGAVIGGIMGRRSQPQQQPAQSPGCR